MCTIVAQKTFFVFCNNSLECSSTTLFMSNVVSHLHTEIERQGYNYGI